MDGILEKRIAKNRVFHAEERIYNLQISLSKLVSLSGSPLFTLNTQILTHRNFLGTIASSMGNFSLIAILSRVGIVLSAPFALSETSKDIIFKIPIVRLRKYVLGSSRQNFKRIQRLTNSGLRFY